MSSVTLSFAINVRLTGHAAISLRCKCPTPAQYLLSRLKPSLQTDTWTSDQWSATYCPLRRHLPPTVIPYRHSNSFISLIAVPLSWRQLTSSCPRRSRFPLCTVIYHAVWRPLGPNWASIGLNIRRFTSASTRIIIVRRVIRSNEDAYWAGCGKSRHVFDGWEGQVIAASDVCL